MNGLFECIDACISCAFISLHVDYSREDEENGVEAVHACMGGAHLFRHSSPSLEG